MSITITMLTFSHLYYRFLDKVAFISSRDFVDQNQCIRNPWRLCPITCREFNLNPNLWETKQNRENTRQRKNNHTHKTIFTWFGNLPTSTELQGFHYYQEKIQSINCSYNISLSPTRQENTILFSYAAARLLGIISLNSHCLPSITNLIYIYI